MDVLERKEWSVRLPVFLNGKPLQHFLAPSLSRPPTFAFRRSFGSFTALFFFANLDKYHNSLLRKVFISLRWTKRPSSLSLKDATMTEQRKAVIKNADMTEEMQQDAVDIASQALAKYNIEKVRKQET